MGAATVVTAAVIMEEEVTTEAMVVVTPTMLAVITVAGTAEVYTAEAGISPTADDTGMGAGGRMA